jgi:hypothetical protein
MSYFTDGLHYRKVLDKNTYVTVMNYGDGTACDIEYRKWHPSLDAEMSENWQPCSEENFYTAFAKTMQDLINISDIELHTLNVEGGAYAD